MKAKELGLLIDKQAYSESSSILHFYTQEKGYQTFIFKGGLKKRKALNQLGLYELSYFKRPESDLGIIHQLDFAWTAFQIYAKPQKVLLVFFLADILKQTLRHQGPDPLLFDFLRGQIILLETNPNDKQFPTSFLAQFLMTMGYAPLLEHDEPKSFDLKKGVFDHTPVESLDSIDKPDMVSFLKAQFWPDPTDHFTNEQYNEGLKILVKYAELHIAGFRLDKTMEILRETLYH
ncbi:MAG: DNA repair protein RecO [Flavobacteriales bacterium]